MVAVPRLRAMNGLCHSTTTGSAGSAGRSSKRRGSPCVRRTRRSLVVRLEREAGVFTADNCGADLCVLAFVEAEAESTRSRLGK